MARRFEPLAVIANPWHALDDEGRPAAHVLMLGSDAVIGGTPDVSASKRDGVHVFTFKTDVVSLRPTHAREEAFYVRQIADGALFAADAPTAARAGVAYVEPAEAIRRAMHAAADAYEAETGARPDWASELSTTDEPVAAETTKRRSAK